MLYKLHESLKKHFFQYFISNSKYKHRGKMVCNRIDVYEFA